ncbi:MAG: hypothetical protein Q4F31_07340 [Eubacteriales bacterium]|nr:hypothetical protein [Eubacteriales bacterium]
MGYFQKLKEEREETRKKNPENKPTQFQATMRIVCGGYLWYLIYEIIRDGGLTQNKGWMLVLMILGLVAFAATGGYCLYDGLKMYKKQDFYNPNAPYHGDDEEADPEENDEDEEYEEYEDESLIGEDSTEEYEEEENNSSEGENP